MTRRRLAVLSAVILALAACATAQRTPSMAGKTGRPYARDARRTG